MVALLHVACKLPLRCRQHVRGASHFRLMSTKTHSPSSNAFVALGSNVGDRIGHIELACHELDRAGLRVIRTSSLYETKPMYVENQDAFINGACEINLQGEESPQQLLRKLKAIENRMGRTKVIDKGPRNIDLDILLYGSDVYESEELIIPHKSMLEREFVLRPLCDLIPHQRHPEHEGKSFQQHLESLPHDPSMTAVTPLGASLPLLKSSDPQRRTQIMSIVNLTPDSFSDGGRHSPEPDQVLPTLQSHRAEGATIIDIGGQSTRPRAALVSAEEELSRILPTVDFMRSNLPDVAISIDTFRHEVAETAVAHGAEIINDVSAGAMDSRMLATVAQLGCTCILMHMRGDPSTMMHHTNYPDGVIPAIASELLERVAAAEAAGIRRWRIILDPGIGFAKNEKQNLEILRRFNELRNWPGLSSFPWLVGPSRKGFIGRITGVKEASKRGWGTAAAIAAAVQGGADVVRVHDVAEMVQVVKMTDAIWRNAS